MHNNNIVAKIQSSSKCRIGPTMKKILHNGSIPFIRSRKRSTFEIGRSELHKHPVN